MGRRMPRHQLQVEFDGPRCRPPRVSLISPRNHSVFGLACDCGFSVFRILSLGLTAITRREYWTQPTKDAGFALANYRAEFGAFVAARSPLDLRPFLSRYAVLTFAL